VIQKGREFRPFNHPISFHKEFMEIVSGLQEKDGALKFRYCHATDANLRESLNDQPLGVHFSMHGFSQKAAKKANDLTGVFDQKEGDFLLFENENGTANFFYQKKVEEFMKKFVVKKPDFLVINACMSEKVGEAFRDAGIGHVVCVKADCYQDDQAAIIFSRIFYGELFYSKNPVTFCQAFAKAKDAVLAKLKKTEAEKLVIKHNHGTEPCSPRDKNEYKLQLGPMCQKGKNLHHIMSVPEQVTVNYMPRNGVLFEIINGIMQSDSFFIQVYSSPGMGKSTMLKAISKHF